MRFTLQASRAPERGCAESQPQQRPPFNALESLDQPSGWPRGCDWSATQSRSAKGAAHSSFGPGRGLLSFLSRALRNATPERGCAESQPQQRPSFNGLEPLDQPSGWPRCCDWSSTQSRSSRGVAHSSFGPGRGFLSFLSRALRNATPERGCAESQPQQRPSFNALEPLDQPSGWPRGCDWSSTQSRSAKRAAHSSFGPGRGLLSCLSRALRTATPERGCAESQPQQHPSFNALEPLDQPSGWPRCCDWSSTQSRSAKRGAHSSFGPGRGFLSFLSRALRTATPERGCAESQPQQRPSFNGLEPLDQPSGWPRCCDWSSTQSRSSRGVAHSSFGPGQRIVVLLVPRPADRDVGARLC